MRLALRPVGTSARAHAGALDDPRVLFVHIPKTAGTSLVEALERWAGREHTIRFPNGGEDWPAYRALTAEDRLRLRLISGHLTYPDLARRDLTGWSAVTLLRDPIARTLSVYQFVQGNRNHPWHAEVSGMTLDAFLAWLAERPHNVDQQCRFIVKEPDADAALEVVRTRFTLVATLEHRDAFTRRLSELLGTRLRVGHANRSRFTLDAGSVSEASLARIVDMNREDLRLYHAARAMGLLGTAGDDADLPAR